MTSSTAATGVELARSTNARRRKLHPRGQEPGRAIGGRLCLQRG